MAGTIGPWFIEPWLKIAQKGVDVCYVVLRPNEEITVSRVTARTPKDCFPLTAEVVRDLWHSFTNLGIYESHTVDTTGQTIEESAELIKNMISENYFRLL